MVDDEAKSVCGYRMAAAIMAGIARSEGTLRSLGELSLSDPIAADKTETLGGLGSSCLIYDVDYPRR